MSGIVSFRSPKTADASIKSVCRLQLCHTSTGSLVVLSISQLKQMQSPGCRLRPRVMMVRLARAGDSSARRCCLSNTTVVLPLPGPRLLHPEESLPDTCKLPMHVSRLLALAVAASCTCSLMLRNRGILHATLKSAI